MTIPLSSSFFKASSKEKEFFIRENLLIVPIFFHKNIAGWTSKAGDNPTSWHPRPSKFIALQVTTKACVNSNDSKHLLPWRRNTFLVFKIALTLCLCQLHFSFNNSPLKVSIKQLHCILAQEVEQKNKSIRKRKEPAYLHPRITSLSSTVRTLGLYTPQEHDQHWKTINLITENETLNLSREEQERKTDLIIILLKHSIQCCSVLRILP